MYYRRYTNAADEPALASPCNDACGMDPATGLCRGCLRTLDEICLWSTGSNREREEILMAIAARRAEQAP